MKFETLSHDKAKFLKSTTRRNAAKQKMEILDQLRSLREALFIELDPKKEPKKVVEEWINKMIQECTDLEDQFTVQRVKGGLLIEVKVE